MNKRLNNPSSEIKLKPGKNSKKSPKQGPLILPNIREGNPQATTPRHFLSTEDGKLLASKPKIPSIKLYSSASPTDNDAVKKGTSFSDWTKSYNNEKPSKNYDSKLTKLILYILKWLNSMKSSIVWIFLQLKRKNSSLFLFKATMVISFQAKKLRNLVFLIVLLMGL